ncbi:hypothetical protein A3Q56_07716 [Intoshia linei]|uniref:Uncharacterized protein n=1 Tax=Intoshia linei TaxID=1819745 RepID=A0A177ATL6_9BILA|nr:hypothetical protein A3Q56_07716 [Intoshia linei]
MFVINVETKFLPFTRTCRVNSESNQVKKRYQVQNTDNVSNTKLYWKRKRIKNLGLFIKTMLKEEGFQSFFKGMSTTLLKSSIASGVIFTSYSWIHKMLNQDCDI